MGSEINDNLQTPLSTEESSLLLDIVQSFHWKNPSDAYIALGSAVLGPICGALKWRPHIYATGKSGSGKSTFSTSFLSPLIGPFKIFAYGDSSSTGITQRLWSDALYVLVEESEVENQEEQKKFQNMLKLARISSSETGAKLYKGTQSHKSIAFEIRSMFCFSSIGVNVTQKADNSRISIIQLEKPPHLTKEQIKLHFAGLAEKMRCQLTPQWCSSLRARTIKLIPTILKNCETFTDIMADTFGNRRAGDQYGTLLAGAYSVLSDSVVSPDDAVQFCQGLNISETVEQDIEDEAKLFNYLMEFIIRIDNQTELSIAEMITKISKKPDFGNFGEYDENQLKYIDILKRWGVRVDKDQYDKSKIKTIWISDSHNAIARILEKTPWSKTWARMLRRLPGATQASSMRFIGSPTRATGLPIETLTGD